MDPIRQRFYRIIRPLAALFMRLVFGYTYEMARNLPENYIVISNHVTDYDGLCVAASFPKQMYFVCSEHVARMKIFPLLKYVFSPIIRPKGASAAATTMEMVRKARRGESVCLFAEGLRSWDGLTWPIVPATGRLVKTAGCGLVTYKLEGGYFASPMWSGASIRRGYFHGAPVRVYTPEELKAMTAAEVQAAIERDLYEDAYARQRKAPRRYRCKEPAKGLENLLYICPTCGSLDSFVTQKAEVRCTHCGLTFYYNDYGMLEQAPFETLTEFTRWQEQRTEGDVADNTAYSADFGYFRRLEEHREIPLTQGVITMDGDVIRCGELEIPMESVVDLAMHGQRNVVFTADKQYYELRVERGNAFKFFRYFERLKAKRNKKEIVR